MCADATDGVEALPIRTAEIIDDGLTKVITIAQRSAGNVGEPRVDGIQAYTEIGSPVQTSNLVPKFVRKSLVDLLTFTIFQVVIPHSLVCFIQKASTFHPGPRPYSHVGRLDIAEGSQAFK